MKNTTAFSARVVSRLRVLSHAVARFCDVQVGAHLASAVEIFRCAQYTRGRWEV